MPNLPVYRMFDVQVIITDGKNDLEFRYQKLKIDWRSDEKSSVYYRQRGNDLIRVRPPQDVNNWDAARTYNTGQDIFYCGPVSEENVDHVARLAIVRLKKKDLERIKRD